MIFTAPDTRKSDGVYSAYFFGYKATGRYSMKVCKTFVLNFVYKFLKFIFFQFFYR